MNTQLFMFYVFTVSPLVLSIPFEKENYAICTLDFKAGTCTDCSPSSHQNICFVYVPLWLVRCGLWIFYLFSCFLFCFVFFINTEYQKRNCTNTIAPVSPLSRYYVGVIAIGEKKNVYFSPFD